MAVDLARTPQINLGRMGPIQLIPPGFMGLLQLKQLGQLPGTLSSVVSGTIELRDWYMTAQRVGTFALFGVVPTVPNGMTGSGQFLFRLGGAGSTIAAVPNGEYWYVEQLIVNGTRAAADNSRSAPILVPAGESVPSTDPIQLGPDWNDLTDPVPAGAVSWSARADRGFWAFPGDQFAVWGMNVKTTTNISAALSLRATRLKI